MMDSLRESESLKRLLRPIYSPPRTALHYLRARRINRAYDELYAEAEAA